MISVVIPNYNGAELLRKNLPRLVELLKKSKLDCEIVIVDDASSDNSVQVIEELVKQFLNGRVVFVALIKLIKKGKNEGFPSTAHRGFLEAKGEVVFVIKNDAVPEKAEYFELMLKHFKDPNVFAVSAGSKTIENGKEEVRGQGVIYYEKGFFLHKRGPYTSNQQPATSNLVSAWPDGSSSAYRRDLYLKLGGFDPIFNPGYWEDVDLGYRAWKAGYRIEFEPRAILLHDFEQSVFKKKYGTSKIRLINLRNQFNFLWCNADVKYLLLYLLWLPYHYAVSLKNWDFTFIKAHLWSETQSLSLLWARWRRRRLSRKTDGEVLRLFQ